MLLALLTERFGLHYHTVVEEQPMICLTLKDGRSSLAPSKTAEVMPLLILSGDAQGSITARNVTMAKLADRLSRLYNVPVIDRTGLAGGFDFEASQSSQEHVDGSSPFAYLNGIRNLLSQVGVDLVDAKGPTTVAIVDAIRRPGPN